MTAIVSKALETELRDGAEFSPELDQLMRKARKASDFLKALSHENRLLLLCLLAERERTVTELENLDIVGIVRRMGVTPDELAALMQAARPSGPQSADPAEKEEANYEET